MRDVSEIAGDVQNSDAEEICEVEIFEASRGVWKFRYGCLIFGSYDSPERARKVAEEYNFYKSKTASE